MELAFPKTVDAAGHTVDLDGRDEMQRQLGGSGAAQLANPRQGVVVRERQDSDAGDSGRFDERTRLEDTVRAAAVRVQVDS